MRRGLRHARAQATTLLAYRQLQQRRILVSRGARAQRAGRSICRTCALIRACVISCRSPQGRREATEGDTLNHHTQRDCESLLSPLSLCTAIAPASRHYERHQRATIVRGIGQKGLGDRASRSSSRGSIARDPPQVRPAAMRPMRRRPSTALQPGCPALHAAFAWPFHHCRYAVHRVNATLHVVLHTYTAHQDQRIAAGRRAACPILRVRKWAAPPAAPRLGRSRRRTPWSPASRTLACRRTLAAREHWPPGRTARQLLPQQTWTS